MKSCDFKDCIHNEEGDVCKLKQIPVRCMSENERCQYQIDLIRKNLNKKCSNIKKLQEIQKILTYYA